MSLQWINYVILTTITSMQYCLESEYIGCNCILALLSSSRIQKLQIQKSQRDRLWNGYFFVSPIKLGSKIDVDRVVVPDKKENKTFLEKYKRPSSDKVTHKIYGFGEKLSIRNVLSCYCLDGAVHTEYRIHSKKIYNCNGCIPMICCYIATKYKI